MSAQNHPDTRSTESLFAQYIHAGWKLCKIAPGEKGPRTKAWNDRKNVITDPDVAACLEAAGLCHAYSNTAAFDIDDLDKANTWLGERNIILADLFSAPDAVQISSGRPNRGKLLYQLEAPIPSKTFADGAFELRCATSNKKTAQDVLPPSIHPVTGKPYEWRGNWRCIPPMPKALLELWKGEIAPEKAAGISRGRGSIELSELRDLLSRKDPNSGYDAWIRTAMAIHYSSDGSAEGLALFDEWSAASPKYPGFEKLEAHWRSFGNTAAPVTADFLRRTDTAAFEDFEDVSGTLPEEKKSFLQDIGDFMREKTDPDEWLVEGRLPAGGTSLLVAKPKVGKSTLSRELAVCVARGLPFLGWNTLQGQVFYLTLEESVKGTQAHLKKLGVEGLTNQIRMFVRWTAPADLLKQLENAIAERKPALIIIDPLFKFFRVKDENNYAEVTAVLQPVQALARTSGAHLLVVHHAGKADREDGDAVLGSTGIFASFDTLVTLKKRAGCRMISTVQRYGDSLEETTLSFDDIRGSSSLGVGRVEAEQHVFEGMIVEWLAGQLGFVTADEIYKAVAGRLHLKRNALRALVDAQRIARKGAGTRGDPYKYRNPNGVTPVEGDVFTETYLPVAFSEESMPGTTRE